jgi:RNA polymerase sigma factor (sigma-70 family)
MKMDGEETSDHDLVARVRTGDDRAFERLYGRYHRRIASYVQGMVHDHARAEDITQDVFMSALRRMRETDRPIAFKPWVYEIAKNACIDQFRRSRRAEEVSMDADEGLGSADYGRLVTKDPAPEAAFETKQQLDQLCGAFGGLSETHHQILVMRELEGLSYREIGERLGMTRPAVESTLFRARRRLTEEYEQLVTGERCQRVQTIIAGAGDTALGTRDRKRVARHVSYCQPCMRLARVSGIDHDDLVHRPVRAKIAALLPLPAFLKDRLAGAPAPADAHASFASWSLQLGTVDPGLVSGWGKAAATAATIAVAGIGAGVATQGPGGVATALGGDRISGIGGGGEDSARQVARGGGSTTSGDKAASGSTSATGASSVAERRGGSSSSGARASKKSPSGGGTAGGRPSVGGSSGTGADAGTVSVGGSTASGGGDTAKAKPGDAEGAGPLNGTGLPVGGGTGESGETPGNDDGPVGNVVDAVTDNPPPAVEVPTGTPGGPSSDGAGESGGNGANPVDSVTDRGGQAVGDVGKIAESVVGGK